MYDYFKCDGRKRVNDTLGGFRGIPGSEDYDCWLGLLHHTNSVYIDEPLFYYDSNMGMEYTIFK